jgi:hypothetical protein
LFGERAIENRLISGEENAASVNYMTFRFRTKLLTPSSCASFSARLTALSLLTPFGLCTLFFLPLQFFLALSEGDRHGPSRKARSILPSVR